MVGCIPFKYSMKLDRESSPWVQIMNMSSMNLSHTKGLRGQLSKALVSNLSINKLA